MVAALLEQNGAAWDAIQKELRPKLKPGRRRQVSLTDIALIDAATKEFRRLAATRSGVGTQKPSREFLERVKRAEMKINIKQLRAPRQLAVELVSKESGKKSSTLSKVSRNRRRLQNT